MGTWKCIISLGGGVSPCTRGADPLSGRYALCEEIHKINLIISTGQGSTSTEAEDVYSQGVVCGRILAWTNHGIRWIEKILNSLNRSVFEPCFYPMLFGYLFMLGGVPQTFVDPNHGVIRYVQGIPQFVNSAIPQFRNSAIPPKQEFCPFFAHTNWLVLKTFLSVL